MRARPAESLGFHISKLFPVFGTTLLLFVALIPSRLPEFGAVTPLLTTIGVFYWTIHREDLHGPGTAFGIGLLEDLLTGAPLGTNPAVLLTVYGIARSQAWFLRTKPVEVSWAGFALVAVGAMLVKWLCYGVLGGAFVNIGAPLIAALLTAACYPILIRLFGAVRTRWLEQDA